MTFCQDKHESNRRVYLETTASVCLHPLLTLIPSPIGLSRGTANAKLTATRKAAYI